MTQLRKITLIVLVLIIFICLSIFTKKYIFSAGLFIIAILLCYKWYLLVTEEFIVYELIKRNNRMELDKLINFYGKKAIKVLRVLTKKDVVEQVDGQILLKKKDYKFSLKQMKRRP